MDLVIVILAALGLAVLLWCVAGFVLLPLSNHGAVTVWHISGACSELECRVRGYLLLGSLGLLATRLALVDCGLSAHAAQVAKRLAADAETVDYLQLAELESYLDQVRKNDGRA